VGESSRGRAIFEGKGACGTCHRVAGRGPRAAPDLSDIGVARAPAALERSLRDPSSAMLPINRPVRIVTKDGRTIRGRRLNEDSYTVQILDDEERLLSIAKSNVRTFDVDTKSTMPAYVDRLTKDEIADVVAYLITLREP
jgi:putative heme-binding domain-containing protein